MIQHEIDALRRIAAGGIAGGAFGCDYSHGWISEEVPEAPSWLFEIIEEDGQLEASFDLYSALWPELDAAQFDQETWAAMRFGFTAPATRKNFHDLASLFRALVAGRLGTLATSYGTYYMSLARGVIFVDHEDDGRAYSQSWEQFLVAGDARA